MPLNCLATIGVCVFCAVTSVAALFNLRGLNMVKCEFEYCIHNNAKICKLDTVTIDLKCYCDSCEFSNDPNKLFKEIEVSQHYLKRKNTLFIK